MSNTELDHLYYIGDPCYVLDDATFNKIISASSKGRDRIKVDGFTLFFHSTAYGDGVFDLMDYVSEEHCKSLGVDAGMLSMIPLASLNSEELLRAKKDGLGALHRIEGTPEFRYSNGTFYFGRTDSNTHNMQTVLYVETGDKAYDFSEWDDVE